MHQGRMRRSIVAVAVVAGATLAAAGPAGAASASGCSGEASSVSSGGEPLDQVSAPGGGGTRSDPFTVEPDGPVSWDGQSDTVITDGRWEVTSSLFSTSGTFDNDDEDQSSEGTKKMTDYVPALLVLPGTYEVDVSVTGEGGSCAVTGFIEVDASPLASAWVIASLVLLPLSLLMLITGRPEALGALAAPADTPPSPTTPPDGGAP